MHMTTIYYSIGAQFKFDQNIDRAEIYQTNFTTSLSILRLPVGSPPKLDYSHTIFDPGQGSPPKLDYSHNFSHLWHIFW